MAPASPGSLQSVLVAHPLDGLFARLEASGPMERAVFESLWWQLCRQAPLFGYGDHCDVDAEHLDHVQDIVHEQLAGWARRGEHRAVEQHAVRAFLGALRSVRGLVVAPPQPDIATLLEPASERLCAAAQCSRVPLNELFQYHLSLQRHYGIHRECFVELIDWCIAAITADDPPDFVQRFVADMRRLSPARFRDAAPIPEPPESQSYYLPPAAHESPVALAELAAASAPGHEAELGAGQPLTQRWLAIFNAAIPDLDALERLPALIENALLVHLLGLEDRRHKAVLSSAADHLLVYRFTPAAREVGARQNRHEPIAVLLVGVLATALRPWSFTAEPLTTDQRIVLLALLAELATAKSRKLLHHEKKHAASHEQPELRSQPPAAELLRTAVNRALARWPDRVHAVSPKQRIDRIAAGFRYMNRLRRGTDVRARDLAIVTDLLGASR